MTTTQLLPPFAEGGAGPSSRRCPICDHEMIKRNGNSDYWVYQCDNWRCLRYAQTGIYEAKDPEKAARRPLSRWSTYERWKAEKRERYGQLRDIGIEPKVANIMAGNRSKTEQALRNGEKNE